MKTMYDYTCYCTAEQTRRAYALGAPLCVRIMLPNIEVGDLTYSIPTTQQMIGWLNEKGLYIYCLEDEFIKGKCHINIKAEAEDSYIAHVEYKYKYYEQAELAIIDAALDYLEKGGNK